MKNPHGAASPVGFAAKPCHSGRNDPRRPFVPQRVLSSGHPSANIARVVGLVAGLAASLTLPLAARAETVIEQAARTGEITMAGPVDVVPLAFVDDSKQLVGYSLDVARRIEAEVAGYLGRPVKVVYTVQEDPAALFRDVHTGDVDLACGVQFTWEREMHVDFSVPFGLSGIRLLTRQGGLDGDPAALAGQRIGVVKDSLGSATLTTLQPKAVAVPFDGIEPAVRALMAGKVTAVAGDSMLLAGAVEGLGGKGYGLVPAQAFSRYAVGCILPENQSTFRNLVNLAIAKLLQGYLNGNPADVAMVERWLGPQGILELPSEVIRAYFQQVLLGYESISVPAASPSSTAPSSTAAPR